MSDSADLKSDVHDFWNRRSCDTDAAGSKKFSRSYFEEIEAFRYRDQPFIHSFAQFTRTRGLRMLEVGIGAGTDFIQWLRAGAIAHGIDLTEEALANVRHRIAVYDLPAPASLAVADAEKLPFESGLFDLGYSFGVLHHTPDTPRALAELVRVIKPGGQLKVMLYNRHCLMAFKLWVKHALLAGKPWRNLQWTMWNHLESLGTKGYTRAELRGMLGALPLADIEVQTEVTAADYLAFSNLPPVNAVCRAVLRVAGQHRLWRRADYDLPRPPHTPVRGRIEFGGNPLGFFHCISAVKTA
jgi:ubiquinone/menaquinone biosynthesis C-methylase UbiE